MRNCGGSERFGKGRRERFRCTCQLLRCHEMREHAEFRDDGFMGRTPEDVGFGVRNTTVGWGHQLRSRNPVMACPHTPEPVDVTGQTMVSGEWFHAFALEGVPFSKLGTFCRGPAAFLRVRGELGD